MLRKLISPDSRLLPFILLLSSLFSLSPAISAGELNIRAFQGNHNITVLTPDDAMLHIRKKQTKPLVVLFSSFDPACKTCNDANRGFFKLSRTDSEQFSFAFVNTQPWKKKELESALFYRLSNSQPISLILQNAKVLRRLAGGDYQKMPRYLKEVKDIIGKKRLEFYGQRLSAGSIHSIVITDKFSSFLTKHLDSQKNYKAVAVAVGKRFAWTASQKVGYLSQGAANYQALQKCNTRWKSKGNSGVCKLYMVGDHYVYEKPNAEIKSITASLNNLQTPLDKYVLKLKKLKNNKALAYAVNKKGNWTSSYVYNHNSEKGATSAVLKSCEKRRVQRNMTQPCSLYSVNDKQVGGG